MEGTEFDEAELFRAIQRSGARALLAARAKDAEDWRLREVLRRGRAP